MEQLTVTNTYVFSSVTDIFLLSKVIGTCWPRKIDEAFLISAFHTRRYLKYADIAPLIRSFDRSDGDNTRL